MPAFIDLTGQRFSLLLVVKRADNGRRGETYWQCKCDCGAVRNVRASHLRCGKTRSCGCVTKSRTHGMYASPEYTAWHQMRQRCLNTRHAAYAGYGGRGITVCSEWSSFENFFVDLGPRPSDKHSLDRVNNNGNYEPSNCRWATHSQQMRNRRRCPYCPHCNPNLTLTNYAL